MADITKQQMSKNIPQTLKQIKKLAKQREKENWDFWGYLKFCDIPNKKLDSLVHELYRKAKVIYDCTQCGNCCKEMAPILDGSDIKKLSSGLDLTVSCVKDRYLEKGESQGEWLFSEKPCFFLRGTICDCYEFRPKDCVEYPHLEKDEFIGRLMGVIDNYAICPRVYYVYEELKSKIWRK